MEETLGKRIMNCRKQLGMTQDQLAEQLGVSAQAVSKWENDQSCPDITTLPRLADIFGLSVDELLGHQRAREGEIVSDTAQETSSQETSGRDEKQERFHFQYRNERLGTLSLAVMVLLVSSLMIAGHFFHWEVSFWGLLWPSALLVFGAAGLFRRFSLFYLVVAFTGGWFLLANLQVIPGTLGELLFPIFLLLLGISLFVDGLRKSKRSSVRYYYSGKDENSWKHGKPFMDYDADNDHFEYSASFSSHNQLIQLDTMRGGNIKTSFGDYTLDLSGVKHLSHDCRLNCEVSFGELLLQVPKRFVLRCDAETAFGSLNVTGHPDPDADVIQLSGKVSFGEFNVAYI